VFVHCAAAAADMQTGLHTLAACGPSVASCARVRACVPRGRRLSRRFPCVVRGYDIGSRAYSVEVVAAGGVPSLLHSVRCEDLTYCFPAHMAAALRRDARRDSGACGPRVRVCVSPCVRVAVCACRRVCVSPWSPLGVKAR
jgi:hypothetical protein